MRKAQSETRLREKMESNNYFNLLFHLEDDLGVDFMASEGKIMREWSADIKKNTLTYIEASRVANSN